MWIRKWFYYQESGSIKISFWHSHRKDCDTCHTGGWVFRTPFTEVAARSPWHLGDFCWNRTVALTDLPSALEKDNSHLVPVWTNVLTASFTTWMGSVWSPSIQCKSVTLKFFRNRRQVWRTMLLNELKSSRCSGDLSQ